jgi:hypothetical protein
MSIRKEAEEAEEAEETEENWSRCLPTARWFFADVLFSRIAPTTLPRCAEVPIVLRYRKRTGDFFSLELRGKENSAK